MRSTSTVNTCPRRTSSALPRSRDTCTSSGTAWTACPWAWWWTSPSQFNFGQNLEVGSDVFLNRNVFLDSKGGIELGDGVGLGENVAVFTHTHSESVHRERTYGKVTIGAYAKIYSNSMILPGISVGEQAIVAAKSMVVHDVAPNAVVAGIPAKVIRERRTEGHNGAELEHVWLKDGAFQ